MCVFVNLCVVVLFLGLPTWCYCCDDFGLVVVSDDVVVNLVVICCCCVVVVHGDLVLP